MTSTDATDLLKLWTKKYDYQRRWAGYGFTHGRRIYREGDPQDHGQGLAVDVMVPVGSEVGNQVAQYAVDNISNAGISYIIYRQQFYAPVDNIYGPANTWNQMPDRGSITENHYDHVHVSFNA